MFNVEGIGERLLRFLGWYRVVYIVWLVIITLPLVFTKPPAGSRLTPEVQFQIGIFVAIFTLLFSIMLIWFPLKWSKQWIEQLEKYRNGFTLNEARFDALTKTLKKWTTFFQWSLIFLIYSSIKSIIADQNILNIMFNIANISIIIIDFISYRYFYEMCDFFRSKIEYGQAMNIAEKESIFSKVSWIMTWYIIGMTIFYATSLAKNGVSYNIVVSAAFIVFNGVYLQMFKVFVQSLLERIEQNAGSSAALPLG